MPEENAAEMAELSCIHVSDEVVKIESEEMMAKGSRITDEEERINGAVNEADQFFRRRR